MTNMNDLHATMDCSSQVRLPRSTAETTSPKVLRLQNMTCSAAVKDQEEEAPIPISGVSLPVSFPYRVVTPIRWRRSTRRRWRWVRWGTGSLLLLSCHLLLVIVINVRVLCKVLLPLSGVVRLAASSGATGSGSCLRRRALARSITALASIGASIPTASIAAISAVACCAVAFRILASIASLRWRIIPVSLPLLADIGNEILAESLATLNIGSIGPGNMQVHRLVRLRAGVILGEPGATALDLHPALGLLLYVLDIFSTPSYDLCTQIESRQRLQIDGNLFLGPFTLQSVSPKPQLPQQKCIRDQIRRVQTALVLVDGNAARPLRLGAPVS